MKQHAVSMEGNNSRSCYRVRPDSRFPVEVLMDCDGRVLPSVVLDISVNGLAVRTTPARAIFVSGAQRLRLSVFLPPGTTPVCVDAEYLGSYPEAHEVVCRFRFDEERDPGYRDAVREVTAYVMERQRAQLRCVRVRP